MSTRSKLDNALDSWVFWTLWLALSVLLLIPIWAHRLLPLEDLPSHMAAIRGWHSYHDPMYGIAQFYELHVRLEPYLTYYTGVHWLLYLIPSIDSANKVMLSVYLVALPIAFYTCTRALGRSKWLAIASFALVYNPNWMRGFIPFLFGLVALLFAIAALVTYVDDTRRERMLVWLAIAAMMTYLSHLLAWALLMLLAITILATLKKGRRPLVAVLLALLPSILCVAWNVYQRRYLAWGGLDSWNIVTHDVPESLGDLFDYTLDMFPGELDFAALAAVLVPTLTLIALEWKTRATDPRFPLLRRLLLVLFFAYLLTPYTIHAPLRLSHLSPREPLVLCLLLLLVPRQPLIGWRRLVVLPFVGAAIFMPLKEERLYASFNRRNTGYYDLIRRVPFGKTVLVVHPNIPGTVKTEDRSDDPSARGPVYRYFGALPMAYRGGYSGYLFSEGVPLKPREVLGNPEPGGVGAFQLRKHQRYNYYLVYDDDGHLEHEFSLQKVAEEGAYALYERKYDTSDEP